VTRKQDDDACSIDSQVIPRQLEFPAKAPSQETSAKKGKASLGRPMAMKRAACLSKCSLARLMHTFDVERFCANVSCTDDDSDLDLDAEPHIMQVVFSSAFSFFRSS
jgi:hypothetical protein